MGVDAAARTRTQGLALAVFSSVCFGASGPCGPTSGGWRPTG